MGENLGAKLVSKCFSTAVVHKGFLSRYLGRKSDLTDARANLSSQSRNVSCSRHVSRGPVKLFKTIGLFVGIAVSSGYHDRLVMGHFGGSHRELIIPLFILHFLESKKPLETRQNSTLLSTDSSALVIVESCPVATVFFLL